MISIGHQHTGATVVDSTRWHLGLGAGGDLALQSLRQGAQTSHQLTGTVEVLLAAPQPGKTTPHPSAMPGASQLAVSRGCSHVRQCQQVTTAQPVPTLLLSSDSQLPAAGFLSSQQEWGILLCPEHVLPPALSQ